MKILYPIIVFTMLLNGCAKQDNNSQTASQNTYKLTAILVDPGDGSGTFRNVNSQKTITLFSGGTIVGSGNFCFMDISNVGTTSGTFSATNSTLTFDGCTNFAVPLNYSIAGSELIIDYKCIEACKMKFTKI